MSSTLSITPFEEQLMDIMTHAFLQEGIPLSGSVIASYGLKQFESSWAGPSYHRRKGRGGLLYPKINLALGRLRSKGLVQRRNWLEKWDEGNTTGLWYLTKDGKKLMGIQ